MATTIGTAYVQILPTTDGITENLTNALTGATTEAGEKSGGSFLSSFGKGMLGGVAAAGAAGAAAVSSVISNVSAVASAGDAIDKTSQKLGVTAEQYQAMAYAAEHSGFEISNFQTAARNLANTDFNGSVWDAVEAIQAIEDPAERAAKAEELLGARAAQQMAPFINGEQTLTDYKTTLEGLGGMMSNESVANAAAFEDAMTDVSTAFGGLKTQLVADFMPSLTDVMNGAAALISGNADGITMITDGLNGFIGGLAEKAPELVSMIGSLAKSLIDSLMAQLPQLIQVGMEVILQLCKGIADALPEMIPTLVDVVLTIVDGLIDNMPMIVEGALQLIVGLATGLIEALPKLIEKAPEIISSMVSALIKMVPEMAKAGLQLMLGLAKGIVDSVKSVIDSVKRVAENIVSSIKGFFGIHSPSRVFQDEIGKNMMLGLAKGITGNEGVVSNAIGEIEDITANADFSMRGNYAAQNSSNDVYPVMTAILAKLDSISNSRNVAEVNLDGKVLARALFSYNKQVEKEHGTSLIMA